MDDFLSGAETVEEADQLRQQLCNLLQLVGMTLRKWRTSSPELRSLIPEELIETGEVLRTIPCMEGSSAPTESPGSMPGESAVSATLANLLPSASSSLARPSEGVYMGEGVPPVPAKLASRIRRGEFVDMGELLPEFWSTPKEEGAKEAKSRRARKVDDIFIWLQSFASYVVVRGAAAPELIAELMTYQSTIVRLSRDFTGLAWVRYDQAYRRQAALTGHTKWSVINTTIIICNVLYGAGVGTAQVPAVFGYDTHRAGVCPGRRGGSRNERPTKSY